MRSLHDPGKVSFGHHPGSRRIKGSTPQESPGNCRQTAHRLGHRSGKEVAIHRSVDPLFRGSGNYGQARSWGCEVPFVRPAELARDDTPGIEPVLHALKELPAKYDYVVLLQPTSPLRLTADIDDCLETCLRQQAPACVTVTEVDQSPFWMYRIDSSRHLLPLIDQKSLPHRRQELPKVYILNGAVYVAQTAWLQQQRTFLTTETVAHIMPGARSLDVDTELDLKICELLKSS